MFRERVKKRMKTPDEIEKEIQEEKRTDAKIIKEMKKRDTIFDYTPDKKRMPE